MNRDYYNSSFHFTATGGDSSSGGGSGSGMECLQLRSPPAPFHYLISEQAKSLVALQELQNEVGALLEFRDLVIETFPNLKSKLSSTGGGGNSTMAGTVSSVGVGSGVVRRDWEPGIRVRRKALSREGDSSLPRSRSDSHGKPKSEGAHSVIQDSGFSTETSSSKEAHSSAAPPPRPPASYEELWQLLDVIQHRGQRLKEEAEVLRGSLGERRALSLNALCDDDDQNLDPAEEFRKAIGSGTADQLAALRRERDLLLDRLAELEAETLAQRVETERLRAENVPAITVTPSRLQQEHQFRSRPSAPAPISANRHSIFSPITPSLRTRDDDSPKRCNDALISDSDDVQCGGGDELGKLDRIMNTPIRNLKVKTPDSRKFSAILRENNPVELQRHLLMFTVHNQILQGKLEKIGRYKGNLMERLHKTREENDDLRFQLEEKTIELEGTRAHVRLLESGGRRSSGASSSVGTPSGGNNVAPRSMRALQPLPLHLQSDEELDQDREADIDDRITETPKKRPSKIPLPPSKLPVAALAPKPPTGRSKDTPSYRSRSGDSLGRPGSALSWRNKSEINSLSGSKSGNSISSTKSPGGRNPSLSNNNKSINKDSLNKTFNSKTSKDSLTYRVKNNDSLSRIRDSALSSSTSVLSKCGKKEGNNMNGAAIISNGKKSSVPVRRASSGRLSDSDSKLANGTEINLWKKNRQFVEYSTYHDSLNSESREVMLTSSDSQPNILCEFITRSNLLAEDRRLQYLNSNIQHKKTKMLQKVTKAKEEIDLAYESPHALGLMLNQGDQNHNNLLTMDVNTVNSTPTKSDVIFFNQTVEASLKSLWAIQRHESLDNNLHSYNLNSVTNDSIKREGLAECDSLDYKVSLD